MTVADGTAGSCPAFFCERLRLLNDLSQANKRYRYLEAQTECTAQRLGKSYERERELERELFCLKNELTRATVPKHQCVGMNRCTLDRGHEGRCNCWGTATNLPPEPQ